MESTAQLNNLFIRWQEEFPEYRGKFASDGIVNESIFNGQPHRLLFITKEPNDPEQSGGDFRKWWSEEVKYSFSHRICEWAYGILNNFPPIEDLSNENKDRVGVLQSIAFMNLKKIGGGSSADYEKIKNIVIKERHLILEEINIIKPDIIVGGIGHSEVKLWKLLFPEIKPKNSGYDIQIAKVNDYRIINFYHPSYRVPRAMSYSLLGAVYRSEAFQRL